MSEPRFRAVRLALGLVRAVAWIVPRRDRTTWQREWEGEIYFQHQHYLQTNGPSWSAQMSLLHRVSGSLLDAAWLRRQFTRDNEWLDDLKHAGRQMRGRPKFYLAATLMLAAGIGSTAAGLSLLDRLVWRALPYVRPGELVSLWQHNRATGNQREEVAPGNFLDWKAAATSFATIAAVEPYSVDFVQTGRPEVLYASMVTDGFFSVLEVTPLRGRLFNATDHVAGAPAVVVISHAFWERLGASDAIVGQPIRLDTTPTTVIGVLPRGAEINLFDERGERDVWLPKIIQAYEPNIRGEGWWASIARLKPSVTRDQAQAEMTAIAARAAVDHPRTNAQTTVIVAPLETVATRSVRAALWLLSAAAALVLLIACANVANLLLVRGAERQTEFAVRGALGASRIRLVRQMLVEAGLLAAVATAVGIAIAWGAIRTVVALSPTSARAVQSMTLDATAVGAAVALGALTVLLFGLVPALSLASGAHPVNTSARWATGTRRSRLLRDMLVVSEVAVAVVLATAVGLLSRSFMHAASVDPGFDTRDVGVVQVFAYDRHDTDDKLRAFQSTIVDRIRAIPGVVNAGTVSAMPLIDANISIESPIAIEGRPPARRGEEPSGFLTVASPGYFSSMGIEVVKGRSIEATDDQRGEPIALVSQTFADRYWPNGDAIGSTVGFRLRGQAQRRRIVGIVEELRHEALELPARDEIFIPFPQAPFGAITFVFRADRDPAPMLAEAKAIVWAVDPEQTIYDEGTAQSLVSQSLAPRRFALTLSSAFAIFALLLAGAGVYTTMSFAMAQQSREFGVKLALGASPARVGRDALRQGMSLCAIGLVVGLVGAVAANQAIRAQLFAVSPFDPLTLVVVAIGSLLLTLVASAGPVRRAMRTDPAITLRS